MAAPPGPGTTIGAGYVLQEVLGDEILGTVWRAAAPNAAGTVRVKLLRPDGDNERTHRFQREAEALGRLRHPSLVRLLDQGEQDGVPFLVFEHAEGRTLDALVREGPLEPDRAVRLVLAVAQGLGAAHREGVVHRNLTAANVIVLDGDTDEVKVRDFGLAAMVGGEVPTQLTRDEARIGSAVAMSPEYAAEAAIGPKGDVYALGVLLYQVMTGRPPFEGREALAKKLVERPVPPSTVRPGLPSWVDGLAEQLLAVDPADRPEIDEVIARLERTLRRTSEPSAVKEARAGAGPLVGLALLAVAIASAVGVAWIVLAGRTGAPTVPTPTPVEVAAPPSDELPLEPAEPPPVVDLPAPTSSDRPVALELVGVLRIRSNRRVLVEVDGVAVGFAPIDVKVPRGPHLVMVALPARPDTLREEEAHVVKGTDLTLKFVF